MNKNTYGKSIGHNLNFEEEVSLSKKIQAGNEAKEILERGGSLPDEEREILNLLVKEGEFAFEQLVNANVPRAMKFAYETWRKNQSGVNDLEDYQQTAMIVICKCARTFDWRKGFRFSTYAHHCLRIVMLRENARTCYALRVPEDILVQLSAAKKNSDVYDGKDTNNFHSVSEKLLAACSPQISLQKTVGKDGDDTELGDILADTHAVTAEQIEEKIVEEDCLLRLYNALEALSEEERLILKGRMGFFGKPQPLKTFVGTAAKSVSGVQKKQQEAVKHLRELFFSLPLAG